jgi:hypothetical protein
MTTSLTTIALSTLDHVTGGTALPRQMPPDPSPGSCFPPFDPTPRPRIGPDLDPSTKTRTPSELDPSTKTRPTLSSGE